MPKFRVLLATALNVTQEIAKSQPLTSNIKVENIYHLAEVRMANVHFPLACQNDVFKVSNFE